MKRVSFFVFFKYTFIFFAGCLFAQANGQGKAFYKAGFPQVAKPLLLSELSSNTSEQKSEACYYLGKIYYGENLVDSATFYFNKGLSINTDDAYNNIGLSMLKIKNNPTEANTEFENLFKKNKKNVDIVIAIADAYVQTGAIDMASNYLERVKSIKLKYAPTYVLSGDIELAKKNIGLACGSYEMATLLDESCKEAYVKYARAYRTVNPKLAIEKLTKLKEMVPSFKLTDKELADIYYATNRFDQAIPLYESYLQSGNSNAQDLTKYAMTLFLNKDFVKSFDVAKIGLQKDPRNPGLNRLAMYNAVSMKQYEQGLLYADLLFKKSQNLDISYYDYTYYGKALRETKQWDAAIQEFQKAYKQDSTKNELLKDISEMYTEKGDFANAASNYKKYIHTIETGKKNPEMLMNLGRLYYATGATDTTVSVEVKKQSLLNADTIFSQVAMLEPTGYRANYWRARTNSALDPESTEALAKPFYEQTATLVESKADPKFNSVLIECYNYMGYWSYLKKNYVLSKSYWDKVLAIDPKNTRAIEVSNAIAKTLNAKKKQNSEK